MALLYQLSYLGEREDKQMLAFACPPNERETSVQAMLISAYRTGAV